MAQSLAEERGQIYGAPRQLEDGTYHVTDLLRRPAALLYDWYTGAEQPEGIPPWLARRGEALEEAALDMMGLPPKARQPEITYPVPGSEAIITGHPDYMADMRTDDGEPGKEIGEVKSQLGTDDEARRDEAVEQALTYAGLQNRLEDTFDVNRVRAVMAGLYEIDDTETVPVRSIATDPLVEYLEEKARTIHQAIQDGDRAACEAFDQEKPPTSDDGYTVTPVADGELGDVCDRIVAASMLKTWAENVYDEERARYQATAEEWFEDADAPSWEAFRDSCKRYAPRLGGTVNVVCKTVKETQESEKLDQYRDALEELEAEWEGIQEDALADLRAEHADLLESIQDQRKEVERLEEQLTVERKEPSYARAWKPGDKTVQDALNVLFDEGGDGSGS